MTASPPAARVLVAGVGNVLRCDDGFGVVVAQRLRGRNDLPAGVRVIETGIGGMSLVQELLDRYDALVVLDAVRCAGQPGTLYVLEPEVPDIAALPEEERQDLLADMHYAEPGRALMLARALGVLPPRVVLLGCEPDQTEELAIGLSAPVARAARRAEDEVLRLLARLGDGSARMEPAPPP